MAGMEVERPSPDVHWLFCHYNDLYFHGALSACFVDWCPRATSSTGTCRYYDGGGCEIRLSEALRKVHPATDLKNVLLHEMIHAFLWIKCGNKDHSDHDSYFREKMKEINSSSVEDHQRPQSGYNITIHHEFKKEVKTYKYYHWICDTCGHMIKKIGEPSAIYCNQKVGPDGSCNNSKCDWHKHKNGCPGSYTREPESPRRCKDQNLDSRGGQEIQERKTEALAHSTKRSIRRLHETEGSNGMSDGKTMIGVEHCLPTSGDVKRNSDNNSSFGDDNQKVLNPKQTNSVDLAPQDRNGVKAAAQKSKGGCSGRKRTRDGERKKGHIAASKWRECMKAYKTPGEWFVVYDDEEEDRKDVEPLRNKRSERRKRLRNSSTSEATEDAGLMGEHESSPEPTRNVQQTENIQTHAESGFGVAQGDECSAPSKLDAIQVSPSTVIDLNLPPWGAIPAEEGQDPQPRHC